MVFSFPIGDEKPQLFWLSKICKKLKVSLSIDRQWYFSYLYFSITVDFRLSSRPVKPILSIYLFIISTISSLSKMIKTIKQSQRFLVYFLSGRKQVAKNQHEYNPVCLSIIKSILNFTRYHILPYLLESCHFALSYTY